MMRWSTAGESHGRQLVALVEGLPAGIVVSTAGLRAELARRRTGYGRGARQKFEQDQCRFIAGVRHGKTLGSPIAIEILNSEWPRWEVVMDPDQVDPMLLRQADGQGDSRELARHKRLTKPRPGHADLTGILKFGFDDTRNVLERASARETVARVAAGYVAKAFLEQVAGIKIIGHVVGVGERSAPSAVITPEDCPVIERSLMRTAHSSLEVEFMAEIDRAHRQGDTVGGVAEIVAWNVPPALGSYTTWKDRLDGQLAQSLMSIPAVKGVEIGDGFAQSRVYGSQAHDEIIYGNGKYTRVTNRAGGIEGGMSNGEPVVARIAVKPIPTVPHALRTVDIDTKELTTANHQRSDTTAIVPAAVIGESMMALTLAAALLERSSGDTLDDIQRHMVDLGKMGS
ncbi:chorismate synthase [Arcanobacterium buesumense]|uniref:Chorismate synthase n=1 Tax=Arcanobacterium buesumense TaxID=2722751 RepID=A0A6H2EKY9_9ACTO|nr:chorismate synthase [Arcanobacterium buesumense]QJC21753.1 chorismate synthase [Arcanobacterium buesumense]